MYEYNEVVAQSMAAEVVGGSQACASAISEGHATIGDMLTTAEGRKELEDMFNICVPGSLDDPKNQEQFAGDGVVYLPVQSNDPSCSTPYCDIASICVLMADPEQGTPLQRLATLAAAQSGGACMPASYSAMIDVISNPKNPERSWLYQTCAEWGFYQTCPVGSQCPYTQVFLCDNKWLLTFFLSPFLILRSQYDLILNRSFHHHMFTTCSLLPLPFFPRFPSLTVFPVSPPPVSPFVPGPAHTRSRLRHLPAGLLCKCLLRGHRDLRHL